MKESILLTVCISVRVNELMAKIAYMATQDDKS